MRRPRLWLLIGTLALARCGDPYALPGTWHATGVNDANLRAMVADPGDLRWGVALPATDGQRAAAAVQRLRDGRTTPLPQASISAIGSAGASSAGAAAPAVASPQSALTAGGS